MVAELQMMVKDDLVEQLQVDVEALRKEVQSLRQRLAAQETDDKVSIICFSGEWDRLFAALTIAAGSLAMGMEVHLFFTFWGMSALRATKEREGEKTFLQRMLGRLLPCGPDRAPLSKLNWCGLGKVLMRRLMKQKGVDDIETLFNDVKELGAHFHLCDTTTELFGLRCEDLSVREQADQCGVTTFLSLAFKSKMVLFV